MKNDNYSLIILKPDFLSLGLFTELKEWLAKEEINILVTGDIQMDLDLIKLLYQWDNILFPVELNAYLCSEPMPIWIIQGENVIIKMLRIKQKLREKYKRDQLHTLIHCPDTAQDFLREYNLLKHKIGESMKTNNQVEVIVFKKDDPERIKYLMLKRNVKKGGFWQPITGNVVLGESFEQAAERELKEETGIVKFIRIFDTGYSFEFFDDNRQQNEKVFAVEVMPETEVKLSVEHTELEWATKDECLSKYLKYPGNIAGLKTLVQILEAENG